MFIKFFISTLTLILIIRSSSSQFTENEVTPLKYDVHITVDNDNKFEYYNATVKINFLSKINSESLILDFTKLSDIHETVLLNKNSSKCYDNLVYAIENVEIDAYRYDLLVFKQEGVNVIEADNEYDLTIKFTSVNFTERTAYDQLGMFRMEYTDLNGDQKYFTLTHLETKYASQLIPCFDDPAMKAVWEVKLTHNKNQNSISNMPGAITETNGDSVTVSFKPTPLMPSYILAISINEFPSRPVEANNIVRSKVYAQPKAIEYTDLAVNHSGAILEALENYLDIKYALPKLDFFIAPEYIFNIQGMENWGLVVYDEESVIFNPRIDQIKKYEDVLTVMAHEIAHQVFGNLITPKKWGNIWLSEGFATYFSQVLLHMVFPSENYEDRFITDKLYIALQLDSRGDLTPLNRILKSTSFKEATDFNNYHKASVIIRMIKHVMGEDSFKKALQSYVHKYQYKSVLPERLSEEFAYEFHSTEINLTEFINCWTNQIGFPLLTVTRNYETNDIKLSQQRFKQSHQPKINVNATWWLPFNFASKSNPDFLDTTQTGWLRKVPSMILPTNISKDEWVVFNKQQVGVYYINYDETNWQLITDELINGDINSIHPINRAQLLHDSYYLAEAGIIDFKISFKLMLYLKKETHFIPWSIAEKILTNMVMHLEDTKYEDNLKVFVLYITSPLFDYYGPERLPNESRVTHLTRTIGARLACEYGYQKCVEFYDKKSKSILLSLENGEDIFIDPDEQHFVYCYGFQSPENYERLWKIAINMTDEHHKLKIFSTLNCHSNTKLFRDYVLRVGFRLPLSDLHEHTEPEINAIEISLSKIENSLPFDLIKSCIDENCMTFPIPETVDGMKRLLRSNRRILKTQKVVDVVMALHKLLGEEYSNSLYTSYTRKDKPGLYYFV